MKTTGLLTLAGTALVALTQPILAVPRDGGGSRGTFGGGHIAGGFSPGHIGGFVGGGARAAPNASAGTRFTGRSMHTVTRAPQQSYYSGARMSGPRQHALVRQTPTRSVDSRATRSATIGREQNRAGSLADRSATINRQQNRSGSLAARNRTADPRSAVNRAIANNRVAERHDANWHHDWNKHRAHFHNNVVFVFVNGFWWGLYPWDYYPYYAYGYPYDYSYDYPSDYGGYSYDGGDYSSSQPYSYYNGYAPSGTYGNGTVSGVQSKLASLGYYNGAIDGILGDKTEAAVARYQQDYDLSVTGTVTAETLHALGLQ